MHVYDELFFTFIEHKKDLEYINENIDFVTATYDIIQEILNKTKHIQITIDSLLEKSNLLSVKQYNQIILFIK